MIDIAQSITEHNGTLFIYIQAVQQIRLRNIRNNRNIKEGIVATISILENIMVSQYRDITTHNILNVAVYISYGYMTMYVINNYKKTQI